MRFGPLTNAKIKATGNDSSTCVSDSGVVGHYQRPRPSSVTCPLLQMTIRKQSPLRTFYGKKHKCEIKT